MKYILLDSIRSMQNVGAVFRNCDGAGYDKIFLTGYTPTPPRNDIKKTAIGAENYIDWEYYKDPLEIIRKLKNKGVKIISVELTEDSVNYKKLGKKYENEDICLVLGNEINGVNEKILQISDNIAIIPMKGKKASLNVSVACGIVMYEFVS
ncbi:MAG: RNA methyltransferase [Candidatus Gracilibacteria bacterium]|nr:RNA methyltransferase [Candidatus Gracilibacteria bacterium]